MSTITDKDRFLALTDELTRIQGEVENSEDGEPTDEQTQQAKAILTQMRPFWFCIQGYLRDADNDFVAWVVEMTVREAKAGLTTVIETYDEDSTTCVLTSLPLTPEEAQRAQDAYLWWAYYYD